MVEDPQGKKRKLSWPDVRGYLLKRVKEKLAVFTRMGVKSQYRKEDG